MLNNEEPVGRLVCLLIISLVGSPELPLSIVDGVELSFSVTECSSEEVVTVCCVSCDTDVGFAVLESDESVEIAVFVVTLVSSSADDVTDGDDGISVEETAVASMNDSLVKSVMWSPEVSVSVLMRTVDVSGETVTVAVAELYSDEDETVTDDADLNISVVW